MDFQDLITIALVVVCVWTFIPRHLRRALRSGLEPAVVTLADAVRDGSRVALKVLTHVAYKLLIGNVPMSSSAAGDDDDLSSEDGLSPPKHKSETPETLRRVGETSEETFTFAETEALARLVASGKLGLTDAVRIGAGAVSGEKYQKRSREIKAAVARLQERYPQRTPEQEQLRQQLGIRK
jgi:hypothetical protein